MAGRNKKEKNAGQIPLPTKGEKKARKGWQDKDKDKDKKKKFRRHDNWQLATWRGKNVRESPTIDTKKRQEGTKKKKGRTDSPPNKKKKCKEGEAWQYKDRNKTNKTRCGRHDQHFAKASSLSERFF